VQHRLIKCHMQPVGIRHRQLDAFTADALHFIRPMSKSLRLRRVDVVLFN